MIICISPGDATSSPHRTQSICPVTPLHPGPARVTTSATNAIPRSRVSLDSCCYWTGYAISSLLTQRGCLGTKSHPSFLERCRLVGTFLIYVSFGFFFGDWLATTELLTCTLKARKQATIFQNTGLLITLAMTLY